MNIIHLSMWRYRCLWRLLQQFLLPIVGLLQTEMKTTFEALPKAVFVIKILNNPIAD